MSAYDVHIGKLISGRRSLEGSGSYLLCTTDKTIVEINSVQPVEGIVVRAQDWEDALYEFCLSAIDEYIAEGNNKEVYTFSIYTDTYHGSYIIYINNQESLNHSVEEAFAHDRQKDLESGNKRHHTTREELYEQFKYGEGDYPFMYDNTGERLEKWLSIYSCITSEDHHYLDIEQNYIVEKELVDSQLFLIAIQVIHRLQADFQQLDRTDDFIAYVSAADGVGGDYLTTSQLVRRCVSEEQLYKVMPDVEERDRAFREAVKTVQQQHLSEQVRHWVTVIEKGEFGEGSPYSFWKTDYEAYEQLIELGVAALPCIQEHLNGELDQDTRLILETVLYDLSERFVQEDTLTLKQTFGEVDIAIKEMRAVLAELRKQDPDDYTPYPSNLLSDAEEEILRAVTDKWRLPDQYIYFLNHYVPEFVTWSTGDYMNLEIFGAKDLEQGQWGYSQNPDTKEVLDEWPSSYLVIASDEGDPYCIDLSRGDMVIYSAEHGTGTWDFDVAYDSLAEFLRSVLLPSRSDLEWDTSDSTSYTYYNLFITGEGSQKVKTLAFIKKKFACDYAQARAYMESLPLLVYKGIDLGAEKIETQLKEIGADYEKRQISLAEFIVDDPS
ncbi:SMI1/KNR4 family protein [Paenibacillus paeoniae]|nr:SMI1/KNR4 family protein [Paenibacillus paeoniae]